MSTYTPNKSLELPLSTEKYNVLVFNKNNSVIDSELHKLDLKNQSQDDLLATKESLNTTNENIAKEINRAFEKENELLELLNEEINRAVSSENQINELLDANIPSWEDKYTRNEIDNKFSALETNIDWKESVETYNDIAATYPEPENGWTVNVKDVDYTYRYNGSEWVVISANAIPKATNSVDGLLSKEDHAYYDDANSKKHTHSNKSVLDGITSVLVSNWNDANIHADSEHARIDAVKAEKSETNGNIKINDTETVVYTHPISSGNKHIPSGGSSGQILRWSADGTAVWDDENNASYSVFKGATSETDGSMGFVPAPAKGNQSKYLRADGTWASPEGGAGITYNDSEPTSLTSGMTWIGN